MSTQADPPRPAHSPELRRLLRDITERMSEFMGVERSTIFLHEPESDELWTPVAQGLDGSDEIRVKNGQGIAGTVMLTGEALRIDDPYADPRFLPETDKRLGFRTRNLFCRALVDSTGRRIGVIQLLNKGDGPLTDRDERLLDVLCSQAGIAIENAQLFERLKVVHDSEQALHARLQANHGELQKAFLEIEHAHLQRELMERRIRKVRLGAIAGFVLLFGAIGLFAWFGGAAPEAGAARAARPPVDPASLDWHVVARAPVSTSISLLGNLEPLEIRHLTSPFRGRVAERAFNYGELVTKDQLLARIDATDLEVELRNARVAAIRARHELRRLEDWRSGPEVARAERALLKARLAFEGNQRNLAELEQLSALGIIAASTLDSARQQFTNQETDFRSAQEELANVLANASEERLTIARYEVENTRLRVEDLEGKLARASLFAPFSGIVILPNARPLPNRNRDNDGFFDVGTTINQGEVLLSVGNLEAVAVRTRADEVDVARIRHGQRVRISGEAFPGIVLQGEVNYLSSQAILTGGRPYFEVGIRTATLGDEERARVRLGMTAKLDILVYDAPEAVVVPVAAVVSEDGDTFVWVRPAPGAAPVRRTVRCGLTQPAVVEILAGLEPGEAVAADGRALRR